MLETVDTGNCVTLKTVDTVDYGLRTHWTLETVDPGTVLL